MEMLNQSLPIVIYFLLIILIIIVIVIGIRLVTIMNKVDKIIEDVDHKVQSLNGIFNLIDGITDKLTTFGDTILGFLSNSIFKVFKSKKKKKEEEEYE